MKLLRTIAIRLAWLLAHLVAGLGRAGMALFALGLISLWALGTRGVPLTVALAERLSNGQLSVAHSDGGWFGPIILDGVVFDTPSARIEIDHLQLQWSATALWLRTVKVDKLTVGTVLIQQKPHAPKPDSPLTTSLPVVIELRSVQVQRLEQRPPEGAAVIIEQLQAQARWAGNTVTVQQLDFSHALTGPVRLQAEADLAPKQITIASLLLQGPAQLKASGRLGLMGEPSALTAHLEQARWPLQGDAQFRVPSLDAQLNGVLVGGPIDAALQLKAALRAALDDSALSFDLDGALRLSANSAHIERLHLVSSDGAGQLHAQGELRWQPALHIDATLSLDKLNPGVLLPDWQGRLNGLVAADTKLVSGHPEVRFSAVLKNSTLRNAPLRLDARGLLAIEGEARTLRLYALTLVSGSSTLTAKGDVWPRLDLALDLDARELNTLLPTMGGAVQLSAHAQGPAHAPAVQARGSAHKLRYQNLTLGEATLDLSHVPEGRSRGSVALSNLQSGDTQVSSVRLEASGRPEDHSITLHARSSVPKLEASLTLQGAADIASSSWRGRLMQSSIAPGIGPIWQLAAPGALSLSAQRQRLEPSCWQAAAARLCLDATLDAPLTRIAYRIESLDTAAYAGLLPEGWGLQTIINGRGVIALRAALPETLDLDVQLGAGRVLLPDLPALKLSPSTLQVVERDGRWLATAQVSLDHAQLQLHAALPTAGGELLTRPLSGSVRVDMPDLSWLTPAIPRVEDLRGAVHGAFKLGGSAGAPQLAGALTLSNGSLRIPDAGIVLKSLQAEVSGNSTGPLMLSAQASSGGLLQLSGTADFAGGTPVVALKISGKDVQLADIADARVWVSPELSYRQDAEGMSLTGTVAVPKADITPRKLAANAIGASSDQVLVGADAPVGKSLPLSAEVTVLLGDAVSFEGFGLKSKVRGQVTAIDRPGLGSTRGRGELRLIDAAYKAYGQEIEVETGRILFNGGPIAEPTVDLIARRSPREDVTVSLHVRGSLDQPTFDLSSSPAMPREQQLGWLIFGRPIDSGSGEFSGAAAALSLGIAGGDALASRLGKIVGLDEVSLGADASSNAWESSSGTPGQPGTDQTRFTVGKYLSPKLFVSYGVGLFDNGNVLRLLYDLGRGFKLRTETGLESGGDLLYSVEH